MDDEDIGEYGIAPQTVKATKDYSTVKKRPRKVCHLFCSVMNYKQ